MSGSSCADGSAANPLQTGAMSMQSWLVAYDICDAKRLRKVARCCEDYGERKQYSVFLCRISMTDYVKLRTRLYDLIDRQEDQVLFIPLCGKCVQEIDSIGLPTTAVDARDVVIVC